MWPWVGTIASALALAACSGGEPSSQGRPGVIDAPLALESSAEAGAGTIHGVRSELLGERQLVRVTSVDSADRADAPASPAATVPVDGASPTISVTVRGFAFPQEVHVAPGTRVVWVNADPDAHDVTAVDSSWGSPVLTGGASYIRDFTEPGRYAYFCTIHPFMQGILIVE